MTRELAVLADPSSPTTARVSDERTGGEISNPVVWRLAAVAALTILLAVRLGPVILSDFPLGDGGLFAVMAQDLRETGFALPRFTSYNDGTIPFVYPPLGIYLLALIPADPIEVERWLPVVYSFVAAASAFILARELVGTRTALVSLAILAAMPVTWAIEGGGVTRGLGYSLFLLALWRLAVMLRTPTVRNAVLAGALAGLGVLAHPDIGPAGAASALLFVIAHPTRRGMQLMAVVATVAAVIVLPWSVTVLSEHGPGPWLLGIGSHARAAGVVRLLELGPFALRGFDPIFPAALVGIAVALRARMWLLPVWLVVLFIVPGGEPRNSAFVWALLAATGALAIYDALDLRVARLATALIAVTLVLTLSSRSYQLFQAVPSQLRGTESIPGPRGPDDPAVEWWPALTGGSSPIVYFGYEWTNQWADRLKAYGNAY